MSNLSPQSKQSCLAVAAVADPDETNLDAVEAISWRIPLDMDEEEEEEKDPRVKEGLEEEEEEEAEEEFRR